MSRDTRKPLLSGDLDHRVTLRAPAGTLATTDTDLEVSLPAAITVLPLQFQSRELFQVGALQAQTVYTVSVRYRTDVLPSYVILEECHTQRRFQILAIVPSDLGDALDMMCVVSG